MILCCGEALIDMLPGPGGVGFMPHTGGAVFNTAIALGRLGPRSGLFAGLSGDFFGDMLRASMHESGVDASACVTVDRPCTLAFVRLVDGQASYAFYDENTAGRMIGPADLPSPGDQTMFFGGISLVVEPCAETYEALFTRDHARCVTMIDPNIRPGFVQDEARYRARLGRMLPRADILKLSDEDLAWLAAGTSPDSYIQHLLTQGVGLILRTDGAKGATAFCAGGTVSVPATRVAVVDTVGAGDTFNAGVLAGMDRQALLNKSALRAAPVEAIENALKLGVAAAAVTVSRAGANPPWAHEIAG